MKKQILMTAMALCLMAGTSVFAQDAKKAPVMKECPTPEQLAQRKTDRMTRELNLTDVQAKQVYQVNMDEIQKMQTMRKQMRASRNADAEKMKSILSTEQFVQWAQMQQGPAREGKRGIHPMRDSKNNDCKRSGKVRKMDKQ